MYRIKRDRAKKLDIKKISMYRILREKKNITNRLICHKQRRPPDLWDPRQRQIAGLKILWLIR